jgi:hypothetical protein
MHAASRTLDLEYGSVNWLVPFYWENPHDGYGVRT